MPADRPQSLDELVGQALIKEKARISLGAALQRGEPLPHTLLTSAGGGLGKTTLAQILANEMYAPLSATTGQCLVSSLDLRNALMRLDPSGCSVLFVDEIHGMGYAAAEEMLLVLEEGVLNVTTASGPVRMKVAPFTLIGATTKPSALSAPLAQRFGLHFHFEFYSIAELEEIVRRFYLSLNIALQPDVVRGIAERSHGIPRVALRLVERVRDVAQARASGEANATDLEIALRLEDMDAVGLRKPERQLLHTLANAAPRPVSARSLALALGIEVATVTEVLEPLLVRLGFMSIGAGGRRLTDKGVDYVRKQRDNKDAEVRG